MTDQTPETVDGNRNPFLAVLGVLALLLAGWGLADGPDIFNGGTLGWTILVVGLVIGLGLVASGFLRR